MDRQEDAEDCAVQRMSHRGSGALSRRRNPADFGRENASACVTACFEEFIPNVRDACHQLQQPEHRQTYLWDLYCCDSSNCGVYIGGIGQSPNVDLIINECQNIGFPSIEDPGPPSMNYCTSSTTPAINSSLPPQTLDLDPSTAQIVMTKPTDFTSLHTVTPSHTASLASRTSVSLPSTPAVPSSSASTGSAISTSTDSSRLSSGVTAAISIFSVLAILAITALLLFLFHRRKRGPGSSSLGLRLTPYDSRLYPGPRSGSLTPLITSPPPASSRPAPLTPPAKLSDRKYLQPVQRQGTSQTSASLGVGDKTLPPSPARAPIQSQAKSRHKRVAAATSTNSQILTVPVPPPSFQYPQSSIYSSSSGPDTSIITIDSNKASSIHSGSATIVGNVTPPSSTTRFTRAHDGPLELPDYVTPAGPPPNRALPAPPPTHPNSPSCSVSPTSPRSPTFPASALANGDGPIVSTQHGIATATPVSISAKELRDLTESYARETRESWGSWSGVGGGGPGVASPGRKKGRGNHGSADNKRETKTVTVSQKLDLEKLGGRY
ncbi:hypothetical protein F5B22DRAFT_117592 [Xylaria bambusicola]|uniref:uncharacterized protein n=1 Tax=Xylaria bambusicola TaxID=326684 RepID=UPI0020083E68|nr:uncharacterized protein F5B22DRAFT_117592 [Xylaria bambusicola]KAI0517318.1 hypothetical protein F5B22DRAFT_117592 [Xylaria bambusicola]